MVPRTNGAVSWRSIETAFSDGFRSRHEVPVARRELYQALARRHLKRLVGITRSSSTTAARDGVVVSEIYEREYQLTTTDFDQSRGDRRDVFLVGGRPIYVDGWFTFEYRAELLQRALVLARAERVLEVGSGRGILLAMLALRQPELELEGIELVAEGVARSYELTAEPPAELLRLCGIEVPTPEQAGALSKLRFHQGDAASMPFEDKAFDVSYTCLSLEQMPRTVPAVLREMSRVTRGYCVFLEPFAEANGPLGMAQLRRLDYFRGSYEAFRRFGLEPVYFTGAIPQKVRFRTGVLVAQVRGH
jgi:SAM-dependent methyltransferase